MSENPKMEEDSEMMSMFASVWVKVEVVEGEDNQMPAPEPAAVSVPEMPPKKKKSYRSRKVLHCDICDYTTVYKNCLEIHVTGHYGVKPYVCDLCPYATKYPSSLYRHAYIKHQIKAEELPEDHKGFKCDHCDYTTSFKWNLSSHKRKHKLDKQFKCPHCPYETAYRHNFIKHSKVHKGDVSFKCDKCPFITKYEGHIQRHLAKIHNEITDKAHMCDLCGFSTKEKWRLKIHKQRSKRNNVIKCTYCGYETYFTCQSKKHRTSHYSEIYGNGRPINCSNLNNEITAMMNRGAIQEKQIETQEELDDTAKEVLDNPEKEDSQADNKGDAHAETNHYTLDPDCVDWNSIQVLESDDKGRPFLCHMCDYTSKFKASVQRHFQRHHTGTKNRPYKCCNCDFSTKTKDQIALHNKRSQTDTIMPCKYCNYSTIFKCAFVMHQKCHYTNKCSICNYSCRHKYELTKHFATLHLGNGLKCQYCDYKAARRESILCHETIHTGVKPFKCSFCDYSSVRKALLDNHMKRYHSTLQNDITVVSDSKIQSLKIITRRQTDDRDDCQIVDESDIH